MAVGSRAEKSIYCSQEYVTFFVNHKDFSDEDVSHLSSVQGLKRCALYNTKVTSSGLLKLPRQLTALGLGGIEIADEEIAAILSLPDVETLALFDCKISSQTLKLLVDSRLRLLRFGSHRNEPSLMAILKDGLPDGRVEIVSNTNRPFGAP